MLDRSTVDNQLTLVHLSSPARLPPPSTRRDYWSRTSPRASTRAPRVCAARRTRQRWPAAWRPPTRRAVHRCRRRPGGSRVGRAAIGRRRAQSPPTRCLGPDTCERVGAQSLSLGRPFEGWRVASKRLGPLPTRCESALAHGCGRGGPCGAAAGEGGRRVNRLEDTRPHRRAAGRRRRRACARGYYRRPPPRRRPSRGRSQPTAPRAGRRGAPG